MSRTRVERYWRAQDPYDAATLAELRHPEWSADWPQSNERIPSHAADVAINQAYVDYPAHALTRMAGSDELWRPIPVPFMFLPVRITGASDFWIAEAELRYPEQGLWHAIALLELRDALAWRETVYYCRSGDAATETSADGDLLPTPLPRIEASMEHLDDAEGRHRAAHSRYLELLVSDPASAAELLFEPTAVVDRPQVGRRISGLASIAKAHDADRGRLPGSTRRIIASGHVLVVESHTLRDGPSGFRVDILEFTGDRVTRATEYFAEATPAPEWRRAWTEQPTTG